MGDIAADFLGALGMGGEDGGSLSGSGGGDDGASPFVRSAVVLVIVTVLVAIGLGFERCRENLGEATEHSASKPIVASLFAELTLMGFIGLVLFLSTQANALDSLSSTVLGEVGALGELIEDVHMVLFLVMVIFLGSVLMLVLVANRLTKSWRLAEVEVGEPARAVAMYATRLAEYHQVHQESVVTAHSQVLTRNLSNANAPGVKRRMSSFRATMQEREEEKKRRSAYDEHVCCASRCPRRAAQVRLNRAREIVMYMSLRARLLIPLSLTTAKPGLLSTLPSCELVLGGAAAMSEAEVAAASRAGRLHLDERNAKRYIKKFSVYAFQSSDPLVVSKTWGESSGHSSDYVIVGERNDIYCCEKALFESTYEPVPKQPHMFRKRASVLARQIHNDFLCASSEGSDAQRGSAGDFLVQTDGDDVQQYAITSADFHKTYQVAEDDGADSSESSSSGIKSDFNAAEYFSQCMGEMLAEMVEVKLETWLVMWLVVALFWGIFVALPQRVFNFAVILSGYALMAATFVLLRKLKLIRAQLASPLLFRLGIAMANKTLSGAAATKHADAMTPLLEEGIEVPSVSGPETLSAGVAGGAVNDDDPFLPMRFDNEVPPFSRTGTQMAGSKGRGNNHEQLFWFGKRGGPALMIHVIRALVLLSALYVGIVGTLFSPKSRDGCPVPFGAHRLSWWSCAGQYVAALIPLIVSSFVLPRVIRHLSIVSSVEMMANRYTLTRVKREMKSHKALRALRLLSAMRFHANRINTNKEEHMASARDLKAGMRAQEGGGDEEKSGAAVPVAAGTAAHKLTVKSVGAAHSAMRRLRGMKRRGKAIRRFGGGNPDSTQYKKRRAEVKAVFDMFDRDGSGSVSRENMSNLLQLLGLGEESSDDASYVLQELDLDKSGAIELDEIMDFLAEQEEAADLSVTQITTMVFNLIDKDKDGVLTVEELRNTLRSLGEVITQEEVVALVHEADANSDGVIDPEEFAALLSRHMREDGQDM